MRDKTPDRIPAEIEATRTRFETWRQNRTGQERIPESLWSEAVEVARRCGTWPTAKALRLDYNKLKQGAGSKGRHAANSTPAFVEVITPEVGVSSGIVEMENGRGARMRIEWKGAAADLVALSRTFWGEGA